MSKAIKKTVNVVTGKESSKCMAFTEVNWGAITRNYLVSIKNLRDGSSAKIVAQAQVYAKVGQRDSVSQPSKPGEMELDQHDERALLMDVSDDDGMWSWLLETVY
ncbi:MAG: hypothetical protein ACREHG_02550 [Candidatus Saccharimonadales bacterium]